MAFTPCTARSALLIGSRKLLVHLRSSFGRVSSLCKLSVCCLCDAAKGPFFCFSHGHLLLSLESVELFSWVVRHRSLKCFCSWVFPGQGAFWKRIKGRKQEATMSTASSLTPASIPWATLSRVYGLSWISALNPVVFHRELVLQKQPSHFSHVNLTNHLVRSCTSISLPNGVIGNQKERDTGFLCSPSKSQ